MKHSLLGYGVEGKSTEKFLKQHFPDSTINIFDSNVWEDLDPESSIWRSPGILPSRIKADFPDSNLAITSQTITFLKKWKHRTIGVTGTKGKGTTCSLITAILQAAGFKVYLIGNIGIPALEIWDEMTEDSWVIYELSSFQLIDIDVSPHISVVLRTTSEHLDTHKDLEEYHEAKANIVRFQSPDDYAILNIDSDISRSFIQYTQGKIIGYDASQMQDSIPLQSKKFFQDGVSATNFPISELQLMGRHNLENILPAIITANILGISEECIAQTLSNFRGLEHRLEFIGQDKQGRKYYNDSFSTTPESTIAALQAFGTQPITLFLGGSDKQSNFTDFYKTLAASQVKHIILIPPMGEEIWKNFLEVFPEKHDIKTYIWEQNMSRMLQKVQEISPSDGIILLSPACASFGIFKDYKDRGDQFRREVQRRSI